MKKINQYREDRKRGW